MNPACPSENCPLNPLINWRLTARTMLKPISITTRRKYGSTRSSSTLPSGAMSASTTISGTLPTSVARHGCGAANGAVLGRMSDFFDDILSEQPRGFDQQDGDEDHERDAVAVLAPARQVPHDQHFDQPQYDRAQHRARDIPDPPKYRGDERLDPRHQSHQRVCAAV